MATAVTTNYIEELRKYWEVPAVAHFCSLFRSIFKLIDFDIEDFEEALIVDTESAADGGRSSLIVDVLIALIRGCLGRKDVTLLNYNQHLHDLLHYRWQAAGLGSNPLGDDRRRACFHILPLYPKIKILHYLCEWRLERPDVEAITKNFSGDYLRVVPMGKDERGLTYWYFYGTRLYCEEDGIKIKISSPKKSEKPKNVADSRDKSQQRAVGGRKRRKRRVYDFGSASRKKRKSSPSKPVQPLKDASDSELEDEEEKQTTGDEDSQQSKGDEYKPSSSSKLQASAKHVDKPLLTAIKFRADNTDENSSATMESDVFRAMVSRIYSKDEDDEESVAKFDDTSREATNPYTSNENSRVADEKPSLLENSILIEQSNTTMDSSVENVDFDTSKIASEISLVKEDVEEEQHADHPISGKPVYPKGKPPWEQELLTPPQRTRWSLICYTLEDWRMVTEKYSGRSRSKCEKDLHRIMSCDFLPAIEKLFEELEKERNRKMAELAPRRASDRLEVKRLQKEREVRVFAEREAVEREKLSKIDEEFRRRQEQEKREQRFKLRELEREKRSKLKDRAREERSRRLELRQMRQQLIKDGKEVPADLLNDTGGLMTDLELDELDIEIEFEHTYGQLEKLIDCLKHHPDAEPFLKPVTEDIAPDYKDVIVNPTDLETIENKLLDREFKSKADFIKAINLMLLNCLQYNGLNSEYVKVAIRFERVFIKSWKRYFPPADLEEFSVRARNEELECISLLGALDRKIKEKIQAKIDASVTANANRCAVEVKGRNVEGRRRIPNSKYLDNEEVVGRKVVEEGVVSGPIDSMQAPAVKASFANRQFSSSNRKSLNFNNPPKLPLAEGIEIDDVGVYDGKSRKPNILQLDKSDGSGSSKQQSHLYRMPNKSLPKSNAFKTIASSAPVLQDQTADVTLQETVLFGKSSSADGANTSAGSGGGQVYALQCRTGTRFCKFVDSNGVPASPELVNQALPILKNCLQQLPKGFSTVTISVSMPEQKQADELAHVVKEQQPATSNNSLQSKPEISVVPKPCTQTTVAVVENTKPVATTPIKSPNVVPVGIKATVGNTSSPTPTSSPAVKLSGLGGDRKLIKVNDNFYCQLGDGSACLMKKDPTTGGLISSTKLSKEEFTRTVLSVAAKSQQGIIRLPSAGAANSGASAAIIRAANIVTAAGNKSAVVNFVSPSANIGPKPICSVAPVVQQQGATSLRPVRAAMIHPTFVQQQSTTTQQVSNVVGVSQQPLGATQSFVLAGGEQLVFTPAQFIVSQGSYLISSPTGNSSSGQQLFSTSGGKAIVLPSSTGNVTTQPQSTTMQVIQVVPQQIVVNRNSVVEQPATGVVMHDAPTTTTASTNNADANDLLTQAWESVEPSE